MSKILPLILFCLCAGCVAVDDLDLNSAELARRQEEIKMSRMVRRFISLRLVKEGMQRKDVDNLFSDQVVVGYEMKDPQTQQYNPITVKNPYRSEVIHHEKKEYTIDYYLLGIKDQDDDIADDELVPLVYQKDKLVGTGWTFLNTQIKEQ